ncbi:GD17812 [Drosophila simulans]|uniref:GD17812 n=1 Tax=Drosophila simulans TaxID=7240 RepID=B4Q5G7_DROSI|nr:GD17812 [Drosophila simulans]
MRTSTGMHEYVHRYVHMYICMSPATHSNSFLYPAPTHTRSPYLAHSRSLSLFPVLPDSGSISLPLHRNRLVSRISGNYNTATGI